MSRKTAIFLCLKNITLSSTLYINEKKMEDFENCHFIINAARSMFSNEAECLPTLAAYRSLISREETPLMYVGFLPYLPYPATEYNSVYTSLCNFIKVQAQLNQSVLTVICDEGVFCIVADIVLK